MNLTSIALTSVELQEVTGYKSVKKQMYALALMEIPFKVRPNGTPFVARSSVDSETSTSRESAPEPVLTPI